MDISSPAKILVSGATGNVGSRLASLLSLKGIPYKVIVREGSRNLDFLRSLADAEIAFGDFNDPETIEKALLGVDKAFLLTNSSENAEAQQRAFVAAAKKAGVKHLVKLSQWSANPHSPVRFLRYHAAIEQLVIDSGINYTFLRPNLFMQGFLGFANSIKRDKSLFAPIGNAKVSLIDVRDIAAVALEVIISSKHENKTYSLTGPEALSHAEIAARLSRSIGTEIAFVEISSEQMLRILDKLKFPKWQAEGLVEDYAHYNRNEAAQITSDVKVVTGQMPISFDQFARDFNPVFQK